MKSIKSLLTNFSPVTDKHVTRDFQEYGLRLAEDLCDPKRKALYIKLAKTTPKILLDSALTFVKDARARNPAALFMWKLKQLTSDK